MDEPVFCGRCGCLVVDADIDPNVEVCVDCAEEM